MINREEYAVCQRRGHDAPHRSDGWSQCKWCGIWRRPVTTMEEREDEPPEEEMDTAFRSQRHLENMKREIDKRERRKREPGGDDE
jgi:hypothetical protein